MSYSLSAYNRLNVTIWASPREVIRIARKKILKKARNSRKFRNARHSYYRSLLAYHMKARALAVHFSL